MPDIDLNGARYHYSASGDEQDETIVFAHGLLWSGRMFDAQVAALKQHYRCIAFDFRGQGQSEVTTDGYDLETLTQDVFQLLRRLCSGPVHYVGLSMGGMVGMRLAARHPECLKSLTLMNTSAGPEEPSSVRKNQALAFIARVFGLRPVVGQAMQAMFGASTLADPRRTAELRHWREQLCGNHRLGIYRAAKAVFSRSPVTELLPLIKTRAQVIVGTEDVATPPSRGEQIAGSLPNCRLVSIPAAGHSSPLEQPAIVNRVLRAFFAEKEESISPVSP